MKLYTETNNYKLYNGNMLELNNVIADNSIDAVVTDPPYELGFMGRSWDSSGIAFQKDTWRKCYNALKPGGYLLAFGGSRTFHRIACAIEDAGFEIRDTIIWLYGSGFPKSMNIGKGIDKRGGETVGWFGEYLKEKLKERGMTQTELSKYFLSKSGGVTGRVSNWINGLELPTNEQFNRVREILNLDVAELKEAKREVVGKGKAGLTKGNIANFSGDIEFDITVPATADAKKWDGWGTALKPSFEPVIVARKPCEGSCTDNVLKWGVGGINIDECRIPFESTPNPATNPLYRVTNGYAWNKDFEAVSNTTGFSTSKSFANEQGRFPANTILTYDENDYDEVCGRFPIGGKNGSISKPYKMNNQVYGEYGYCNTWEAYNDSGSASRYFYCAKASKRDRDEGLEGFEVKQSTGGGGGIGDYLDDVNSCSGKYGSEKAPARNFHPTVKPTALMSYLVRLVSPKGATILDPFMGSGSTGKAVMYENKDRDANYKFVGIELTDEYLPIAQARILYAMGDTEPLKVDVDEDIEEEPKERFNKFDWGDLI